jgi:hypothetical protein
MSGDMALAAAAQDVLREVRAERDMALRYLAAALDACEYADSEGFQWPMDPFGEVALAFSDPAHARAIITQAIKAQTEAA